jgi:hypothetical protein
MMRGAVIGFVLACVLPAAGNAGAAEATLDPNPTGYYTKTQDPFKTVSAPIRDQLCSIPSPDPRTCVDPSQLTGGTPGYPRRDNYVYVATINGDDDARGVIGTPLFSVPLGSTIRSLVLDFQVENEQSSGTLNFDPDNPMMQFCLITEGWAGQDAAPYESQPDTNCQVQATPKKVRELEKEETTEEGAPVTVALVQYTVDLMPMARAWANGAENNGVMVRPTPNAPIVFEAALRPPSKDGMSLKVTYDAPKVAPAPTVPTSPTENAPTFGDDAEEPETPAGDGSIDVPEEPAESDGGDVSSAQPVSNPTTPWWTYLALPLGLATLAGLGRGTTDSARTLVEQRAGPVSRLMDRGGRS